MAYTDFAFYRDSFFGTLLTETDAPLWLERASDEVDALTSLRLVDWFPENEIHAAKVRKAVCAVAETLYLVEQERLAVAANVDAHGALRPAVSSISAGRESISYAQSGASSVYAKAVGDRNALDTLIQDTAARYLAGIPDGNGVNLLYRGWP